VLPEPAGELPAPLPPPPEPPFPPLYLLATPPIPPPADVIVVKPEPDIEDDEPCVPII